MSVLVVGVSHHNASVALLERAALDTDAVVKALHELSQAEHVTEALVLSTCNRIELYADVRTFHGGVSELTEVFAAVAGIGLDELEPHLHVHYEDRAVTHLFRVACGLESMVVGETQILGQFRAAYRVAEREGTVGRVLGELGRTALRIGKRAHHETGIDRAGASLVGVGIDLAEQATGPLGGRTAAVIGAGSMGALAGATLLRRGAGRVLVANRSAGNAARLADALGGEAHPLVALVEVLTDADVVVASTGAIGTVIDRDTVAAAMDRRAGRELVLIDLALPRDIDPGARELPGVRLWDLDDLGGVLQTAQTAADVAAVRAIVDAEVASFLAWRRAVRVSPTVTALRRRGESVVDAEWARLAGRLPDLDPRARAEVASALHRVADKLLHPPTVRVKQLADDASGERYAEALRELFDLEVPTPAMVALAGISGDGAGDADPEIDLESGDSVEELPPYAGGLG